MHLAILKARHYCLDCISLTFLLALTIPLGAKAQYSYTTNNGAVTITKYDGAGGALAIPSVIAGLAVTTIADFAFYANSNLTSVTIPNGVTNIGFEAFYSCSSLTGVSVPASAVSIGHWAFQDCTNLTSISVDGINSKYSSVGGVLLDKNQATLIAYPGGKIGSYAIPNTISNIDVGAFGHCDGLTGVTIPKSVRNIADSAFYSCLNLTSVTIPDGVTNIGGSAFYSCSSLGSVSMGNNVATIGDYAFASCPQLTTVTLDNNLSVVGFGTFSSSGVESIVLPNSVTMLGDAAFEYCSNLTSVIIGNGLTSISDFAFDACNSLFDVAMGKNVVHIGVDAFGRCTSLTRITIPKSVSSIGATAFLNCSILTAIYFEGDPPTDDGSGFSGDLNATLFYLPSATGWAATFDGLPTALWNPTALIDDSSFGVKTNRFGFNIAQASNSLIVVEACTNLANPVWFALQTNQFIGNPSYFSDPQWTNYPSRFYRIRSP
jgi:hypothetical protein